jgi:hypothetical protein
MVIFCVFAKLRPRPDPQVLLPPRPLFHSRYSTPLFPKVSGLFCAMGTPQPLSFQSLVDSFHGNRGVTPLFVFPSTASSPISPTSRRASHFSSTAYKMLLPQLLCFDNDPFSWWGVPPPREFSPRIKTDQEMTNPNYTNGSSRCLRRSSIHKAGSPCPRFASHPHSFLLNYIVPNLHTAGPAGPVPHSVQRPRSKT